LFVWKLAKNGDELVLDTDINDYPNFFE